MSKNNNKKKPIEVVKKRDNTIEVAIRENPAKTRFGRIAGIIILIGFVATPVIGLIFILIDMMSNI